VNDARERSPTLAERRRWRARTLGLRWGALVTTVSARSTGP